MHDLKELINILERDRMLSRQEFIALIDGRTPELAEYLFEKARHIRQEVFGRDVYIRGLIEFTNYCKNDCCYCGIRRSNRLADRYRLTPEDILDCCRRGYELGFRTFVLQGGEDGWYLQVKDSGVSIITDLIRRIKSEFPVCALTLSFGEHDRAAYLEWFEAGADRYLLRHETACDDHYRKLHPPELSLTRRKECLRSLKEIGYQTGSGFMVGSPGQTTECLAEDLLFLYELQPHMIGIGPFVPHKDTPFAEEPGGTAELTLFLLGILRLMFPGALLPATTALGTIDPNGREKGILAGANVVMPNLSPANVREKYALYNNKLSSGSEAAEALNELNRRLCSIGYRIRIDRGDAPTLL